MNCDLEALHVIISYKMVTFEQLGVTESKYDQLRTEMRIAHPEGYVYDPEDFPLPEDDIAFFLEEFDKLSESLTTLEQRSEANRVAIDKIIANSK